MFDGFAYRYSYTAVPSKLKLSIYQSTRHNSPEDFNLLKPTRYVKHHQFNIQQLCVLFTLYLCVLYLSENKQRLVLLTA
jgi:hypothetical protein